MDALPATLAAVGSNDPAKPRLVARGLIALIAVSFAASLVAAFAILMATDFLVPPGEVLPFSLLSLALIGLAAFCRWRYDDQRLAHASAIVGTAIAGLLLCAVVSNAGLRLGMPLADDRLAAADALFAIDAGSVIRAVAQSPLLVELLGFAYNTSGLLVVLLIAWSVMRGATRKAWELVATTVVSMQLVALVSLVSPAWGAMKHFSLEGLQGHGLPIGAGVYQWTAFAHFYQGSEPVLRLSDMGGVVAFPSFHTVLALLVTQALAETRLRWLATGWTATIILAAIPMGGHYASDLAAGWCVWLVTAALSRRLNSPSG